MRCFVAALTLLASGAHASTITFDFTWAGGASETGTDQWFMEGQFFIDSSSLNTGIIDESAVLDFHAIAYETVTDTTIWEFTEIPLVFSFAFDSDNESFQSADTGLPLFNWWASPAGAFQSGSAWELLYEPVPGGDPAIIQNAKVPAAQASLTVSRVPIPAAVWLFGSGLGLLGWFRRKA